MTLHIQEHHERRVHAYTSVRMCASVYTNTPAYMPIYAYDPVPTGTPRNTRTCLPRHTIYVYLGTNKCVP